MIETIQLGAGDSKFDAFVCRPMPVEPPPPGQSGTIGGIILVHEIWGLVDHIKDIADRFCDLGYLVVAPDLLTAARAAGGVHNRVADRGSADQGSTDQASTDQASTDQASTDQASADELQQALFNPDPEVRNAAQPRLRELFGPLRAPEFTAQALRDLHACFDWLETQPGVEGRIAIVGFCFGGTQAFNFAADEPRLKGAVSFYGQASLDEQSLRDIRCRILAFYGEKDNRLVDQLPQLTRDMQAAGVNFKATVFDDCGHAFFNDSNPYAYNADAATRAWVETVEFLSGAFSS